MIVFPKDPSLLDTISDLVLQNEVWPFGQIKIGNYLINMNRFPDECLVFDEDDNIIDGYVISPTEYVYNGNAFSKLLGK